MMAQNISGYIRNVATADDSTTQLPPEHDVHPRPAHALLATGYVNTPAAATNRRSCQKFHHQSHEKVETICYNYSQAAPGELARSALRRIPTNTANIADAKLGLPKVPSREL